MIATPDLIESLVAKAGPVKRLRPLRRALLWLAIAGVMLTALALIHGPRPDLSLQLREPVFVVGLGASIATAILSAIACFFVSLPDRSRAWMLLPAPTFILWVSTVSYGCMTYWIAPVPADGNIASEARCLALLVMIFVPLSLVLLLMVRHAVNVRPRAATTMGSLAVAGVAATALAVFHEHDAAALVLFWNFGTLALVVGLGSLFGNRALAWISPRPVLQR